MKRTKRLNNSFSDQTFNTVLLVLTTLWLLIVLYPLIYIVSSSFSSGTDVTQGRVLLWPVNFSLTGYEIVLKNAAVWQGYKNTILYTVLGTILNVILTILTAFPLSRSNFQGRKILTAYCMIPMFFGGGLIPTYMLVSGLGLTNTRLFMIISGALNISNMIIMRTSFKTGVPSELFESAKLDGISDIGFLLKIVLPLTKATTAVIILYYLVGHWNDYFTGLIYLRDRDLYPLQLILRDILNTAQVNQQQITDSEVLSKLQGAADVMKYSLIVVSTLPMLVLYPFVQKFFEKGVMVGSVKG